MCVPLASHLSLSYLRAAAIVDDLLELYTNYSTHTIVGPKYQGTAYLNARIELNRERK